LTKIRGGEESPTVPSKCDIYTDLRIPPQLTSQQVLEEAKGKIKQYQTANLGVSVRVKIEDLIDPFEVDPRSPLVRALSWAIRKVRCSSVRLLRKTGTGDMNVLGNALKKPVVTYGPGDSHLDHTPNEHIEIQEYLDSIQVYREAIMKLFELHEKHKKGDAVGDIATCCGNKHYVAGQDLNRH